MLIVGGQLEVDYAKIALAQSQSEPVRRFARRMVTGHSAVVDNTEALSARLHIPSDDSGTSKLLEAGGAATKG